MYSQAMHLWEWIVGGGMIALAWYLNDPDLHRKRRSGDSDSDHRH